MNLCGRLSIRETAAVMKHADVYLGHDSGPMHLAAAAGVPCVGIYTAREHAGNLVSLRQSAQSYLSRCPMRGLQVVGMYRVRQALHHLNYRSRGAGRS